MLALGLSLAQGLSPPCSVRGGHRYGDKWGRGEREKGLLSPAPSYWGRPSPPKVDSHDSGMVAFSDSTGGLQASSHPVGMAWGGVPSTWVRGTGLWYSQI